MIEFVERKDVLARVFFYAEEYAILKRGDSSKSLHAICIWNGKLKGHVGGEKLKYVRSQEIAKMFSDESFYNKRVRMQRIGR